MSEENTEENKGTEKEEEIEVSEVIEKIKNIYKGLSVKDFVIILLCLMMFMIYILYIRDIDTCIIYYQNLIRNMTQLTTPLW